MLHLTFIQNGIHVVFSKGLSVRSDRKEVVVGASVDQFVIEELWLLVTQPYLADIIDRDKPLRFAFGFNILQVLRVFPVLDLVELYLLYHRNESLIPFKC